METSSSTEHTEHAAPIVQSRSEHTISRADIDEDALKVMYRLKRFGHVAYLVGGSVRDLLLGRAPKDFDIGTDATPRQVKKLFRNCYLVGKRFKLAHVRFRDKVIETSTFRCEPEGIDENIDAADHRQRKDNAFGTPAEDARRRDFTVNALFYDLNTFSVIDHVGGFEDLKKGVIRSIGDPDLRFKEDPVRMLRAVRFAAKLGFDIEESTFAAISRQQSAITTAAPSRLMDEILKLFEVGATKKVFELLRPTGLLQQLFPEIDAFLSSDADEVWLLWDMLRALDQLESRGVAFLPGVRLAAVLYAPLRAHMRQTGRPDSRGIPGPIANAFLDPLARRFQMPRQLYYKVLLLLSLQKKLGSPPPPGAKHLRLVRNQSFPDALALSAIITRAEDRDPATVIAWQIRYEEQSGPEPGSCTTPDKKAPKRRNRRRRKPRGSKKSQG